MAEDTTTTPLVFTRQLAGAEDLLFGFGAVSQVRQGDNVTLTKLNASTIPYDSTRTVADALDEIFTRLNAIGA